jgi:hypothetical protein
LYVVYNPVVSKGTELGFLDLVDRMPALMESRARQAIDNTATAARKK